MDLTKKQVQEIKTLVNLSFRKGKGRQITLINDNLIKFNDWVAIPPFGTDFERDPVAFFGRIVQVRLRAGIFGSDVIFLRLLDHRLITWENQFFRVMESDFVTPYIREFTLFDADNETMVYSALAAGYPGMKGFIK